MAGIIVPGDFEGGIHDIVEFAERPRIHEKLRFSRK